MRKRMRRRLLSMLTALCMVLSLLPGSAITAFAAAADFAGGDGTLENPYQIKTVEQLKKMEDGGTTEAAGNPRYYILTQDLTGVGTTGIDTFSGYFNGQGHTISGLVGGLVKTNNGTLRNVKLVSPTYPVPGEHPVPTRMDNGGNGGNYDEEVFDYATGVTRYVSDMNSNKVTTYYLHADMGFAAGINAGTVDNVTVTDGTINGYYTNNNELSTGNSYSYYNNMLKYAPGRIGGVVGYNFNGIISNCTVQNLLVNSDITIGSTGGIAGAGGGGITGCVVDGMSIKLVASRAWRATNLQGNMTAQEFYPWAVGGIAGRESRYRNSYLTLTGAYVYRQTGTSDQPLSVRGHLDPGATDEYLGVTSTGTASEFPLAQWNTNASDQTTYPGLKNRTDIHTVVDTAMPAGKVEVRIFDAESTPRLVQQETYPLNTTYKLPELGENKSIYLDSQSGNRGYDIFMNGYRVTKAVDGVSVNDNVRPGEQITLSQSVNVYEKLPVKPYLSLNTAIQAGQSFVPKLSGWQAAKNPVYPVLPDATFFTTAAFNTTDKFGQYIARISADDLKTMAGQLILSYRKQGSEEALSAVPEGAYGIYSVTADAKNWSDPEQFKSPSEPPQLWYPAPLSSDRLTIANPVMGYTGSPIEAVIPALANAGVSYTVFYEGINGTAYEKSSVVPAGPGTYQVTVDADAYFNSASFDSCWGKASGVRAGTFTISATSGGRVTVDGTVQTEGFSIQSGGKTCEMKNNLIDLSAITKGSTYDLYWTKNGRSAKVYSGTYDGSGSLDLSFRTVSVYAATDGADTNAEAFGFTDTNISAYGNVSPYRSLLQYLVPVNGKLSDVIKGVPQVHTARGGSEPLSFKGWTLTDGITPAGLNVSPGTTAAIAAAYETFSNTAASDKLGLKSGETYYFYDKDKTLSTPKATYQNSYQDYGNLTGGDALIPMIYGGSYRLDTYGFDSTGAPDWSKGTSAFVNRFLGAKTYDNKSAAFVYQYLLFGSFSTSTPQYPIYNPLMPLQNTGVSLGGTMTCFLPTAGRDASAGSGVLSGSGIAATVNPWNDRTQLSRLLGEKADALSSYGEIAGDAGARYDKFGYEGSGTPPPFIVSLTTNGKLNETLYPGTEMYKENGHPTEVYFNPKSTDHMGIRLAGDMTDQQMENGVIVTLNFGALAVKQDMSSLKLVLSKNADGTYTLPAIDDLKNYVTGESGWVAEDGTKSFYVTGQNIKATDTVLTAVSNPKPLTSADCTAKNISQKYTGWYGISSVADYKSLMAAMKNNEANSANGIPDSSNLVLLNDLDFEGISTTMPKYFKGTFDGNGKTIRNLSSFLLPMVYGTAEAPAALKNLRTEGAKAGLIETASGTVNINRIITLDCVKPVNVLISSFSSIGGSVALTVEECYTRFASAAGKVAPMVANDNSYLSTNVTMQRCVVDAEAELEGTAFYQQKYGGNNHEFYAEDCLEGENSPSALNNGGSGYWTNISAAFQNCAAIRPLLQYYQTNPKSLAVNIYSTDYNTRSAAAEFGGTDTTSGSYTMGNCYVNVYGTTQADLQSFAWKLNHGGDSASNPSSGRWTLQDGKPALVWYVQEKTASQAKPSYRVTFTPGVNTTYTQIYGYTDYTGKIAAMPTENMLGMTLTYQSGGRTLSFTKDTVLAGDTTVTVTAASGTASTTPVLTKEPADTYPTAVCSYGKVTYNFDSAYAPAEGTVMYLMNNDTINGVTNSTSVNQTVILGANARSVTFTVENPAVDTPASYGISAKEPNRTTSEIVPVTVKSKPAPVPSVVQKNFYVKWGYTEDSTTEWPVIRHAASWSDENQKPIDQNLVTCTSGRADLISVDERSCEVTAKSYTVVGNNNWLNVPITVRVAETDTTCPYSVTYTCNVMQTAVLDTDFTVSSPQYLIPKNGTVSLVEPVLNSDLITNRGLKATEITDTSYTYNNQTKPYDEFCKWLATLSSTAMEIRFSCGVSGYNGTRGNKIVVVIPSFTYTNPLSVGAAGAPSGYQGTYADTWGQILNPDSSIKRLVLTGTGNVYSSTEGKYVDTTFTKTLTGTYRVEVAKLNDQNSGYSTPFAVPDMSSTPEYNRTGYRYRLMFTGTDEAGKEYKDIPVISEKNLSISGVTAAIEWGSTVLPYTGKQQAPIATVKNKGASDDVTVTVTGVQTEIGPNDPNTSYTATAEQLTGADAGKFSLPQPKPTTTFSIVKPENDNVNISDKLKVLVNGLENPAVVDGKSVTEVTYGQPVTVEFTPMITGSAETPPDISGGATLKYGETVLATASAPVNGKYTLVYNTANKVIPLGVKTLTVTYNGNAKLGGAAASADIMLNSKTITVSGITAANRPYIPGNTSVDLSVGTVTFDGKVGSDSLSAAFSGASAGTVETPYAGTAKPVTIPGLSFGGTDQDWYTFAGSGAVTVDITPKVVTNPTVTADPGSYIYTGSAITPATVTVKDGTATISDAEYTLSYADNTNAGTAGITVTDNAGGNYTVSGSGTFGITAADPAVIMPPVLPVTYGTTLMLTAFVPGATGGTVTFMKGDTVIGMPVPVTVGGAMLPYPTTAKLLATGSNAVRAVFSGDGNHNGAESTPVGVIVNPKNVTVSGITAVTREYAPGNKEVVLSGSGAVFTGKETNDIISIGFKNAPLGTVGTADAETGKAVTLPDLYLDGKDAGWYVLTGNTGAVTADITPKVVTNPTVTADPGSYIYTGSAITPATVTVKDGTATISNAEYTLSYGNNTAVGTAGITVTDNAGGNYTVNGSGTYTISKAPTAVSLTASQTETVYGNKVTFTAAVSTNGASGTASGTVTFRSGGNTLGTITCTGGSAELEYDTFLRGLAAGDNTVTAEYSGDGSFDKSVSAETSVTITARSITLATVSDIPALTYDGTDLTPAVTVTDGVKVLTADTDYTVTFSGNRNEGTASVTVTGAGCYSGSMDKSFTISKRAITIKAKDQTVTYGTPISGAAAEAEITVGSIAPGEALTGITLSPSGGNVTDSGTITPDQAVITHAGTVVTANYEIRYQTGTLVIGQAALTGAKNAVKSLRYTNTGTQTLTVADFGITGRGRFTANGSVTGDFNILAAPPSYGESIVYSLTPGLSFAGQQVIIPVTFTPEDTNYASVNLTATVTLADKLTAGLALKAARNADNTVTFTAVLDQDGTFKTAPDVLDGDVKFVLDQPLTGEVLGTAAVKGSGAEAEVILDLQKLSAGAHTVYAVYSGNADYASVTKDLPVQIVSVTELSMNTELLVLRTGGTGTLTVTVEPADATIQSLKWNSDNQAVATVDEKGVVTAVGTGSAVITAVSDDMGGISVSCLVVVSEKSDIYLEKLVSKDETELRAGDNAVYASPSNATMSNAEILYCDIEIPGDTATVSDAKEYQRFEAGKSQPVRSITWDDVVYTIWHVFYVQETEFCRYIYVYHNPSWRVVFDPNGGLSDEKMMKTDENGYLKSLPGARQNGYTFDGWFTAVSGGTKAGTLMHFGGETTLYAHWTKINSGNPGSGGSGSGGGSSPGGSYGGWTKDQSGWRYVTPTGGYADNSWKQVNGKWYHFGSDGYMQTGWILDNGKWYYLDGTNGDMKTEWILDNGKWYYLDSTSGDMKTGYLEAPDGHKYYFLPDGSMATGDIEIDGVMHHFNDTKPAAPTYEQDPVTGIWKPNGNEELPYGAETE